MRYLIPESPRATIPPTKFKLKKIFCRHDYFKRNYLHTFQPKSATELAGNKYITIFQNKIKNARCLTGNEEKTRFYLVI